MANPKTAVGTIGFCCAFILSVLSSCNGQKTPQDAVAVGQAGVSKDSTALSALGTVPETTLSKNVRSILQDRKGNYWFATDGEGVYRYDGNVLAQLTVKDGLCSNAVWNIQEDATGNIWFSTANGVCRFDGKSFTDFSNALKNTSQNDLRHKAGDLFFSHGGEVYHFDGKSFSRFVIYPASYHPDAYNLDRPYGVYCILEDRSGNLWFGTDERGVCRYDGKSFTYFSEKGLGSGAVRSIFQDRDGNLWFGNNGHGLFRYDGKKLTNVTEEKGLGNPDFLQKAGTINKPASLARVWAISQDRAGDIWIGTTDAGVWRYDGSKLTNYTVKDGLTSDAISAIYKDHNQELWFITEKAGICRFNGKSFIRFAVKAGQAYHR